MTITYTDKIYSLLLRWRGSVWRLVWKELIIWLVIWFTIRLSIKQVLPLEANSDQEKQATEIIRIFKGFCTELPLVMILGFFVGQVVSRWWSQVQSIPWPEDCIAFADNAVVNDDDSVTKRENIARWLVLSEAMVFRQVSKRVYKRFPELENLMDAGLMTKQELELIRMTKCENLRWELPLEWIMKKVAIPGNHQMLISTLSSFKRDLRNLFMYDWIQIPLVYTQTVAVVVYGYFAYALVGHQELGQAVDYYIPWLSVLQFIFYVGWFKVACELMHPFGESEDGIELNVILDRHAAVAWSLATEAWKKMPDFVTEDKQREEIAMKMLNNLTYSIASTKFVDRPPTLKSYVNVKMDHQIQVEQKEYKQEKRCCGLMKSNTRRNFF